MRKANTIDNMLAMADELYEDDFMVEAVQLYQSAMLRQEPSKHHLHLLGEARRVEALQFIAKLKNLYPNSLELQIQFALLAGGTTANKTYSILIEETDNSDIENQLRYLRWQINCNSKSDNHEQLLEDFIHLWQADWQRFRHILVKTIQHEFLYTDFIPFLEQLNDLSFLNDNLKKVITAKIEFLRVIQNHAHKS